MVMFAVSLVFMHRLNKIKSTVVVVAVVVYNFVGSLILKIHFSRLFKTLEPGELQPPSRLMGAIIQNVDKGPEMEYTSEIRMNSIRFHLG